MSVFRRFWYHRRLRYNTITTYVWDDMELYEISWPVPLPRGDDLVRPDLRNMLANGTAENPHRNLPAADESP